MRLLEVMAETSDRGRSLLLAQLLHHPNLQVRSKAALLVGKSNQDVKWVSHQMSGSDSRVRANAAGNGIQGLYRLGMPSVIGSILTMIAHTDDGFRKTGIWLIGETGDLRFLPVLGD